MKLFWLTGLALLAGVAVFYTNSLAEGEKPDGISIKGSHVLFDVDGMV